MRVPAFIFLTPLLLCAAPVAASECGDANRVCKEENRAAYERCVERARGLADDPRTGSDFGTLRALCAKTKSGDDQICNDSHSKCSREWLDTLKQEGGLE